MREISPSIGSKSNDSLVKEKREEGVEPSPTAPQAAMLPLHHNRHDEGEKREFFKLTIAKETWKTNDTHSG